MSQVENGVSVRVLTLLLFSTSTIIPLTAPVSRSSQNEYLRDYESQLYFQKSLSIVLPKMPSRVSVLIFIFLFGVCCCYKPVFFVHGILSQNSSMVNLSQRIQEHHPGTRVYVSSRFCGWNSLLSIMHQAKVLGTDLLQVSALHPEGFHMIGYSQGGLLARAMLELYPYHNVHTFISLSSPQAGQYGTQLLRMFFPTLMKEEAYKFLYSKVGQYISVGNFWNDPHHQSLYLKYNKFLPIINNETFNSSSDRKTGIAKLKKLVLIGGPDDEIIEPWQSSHFAFYNKNETVIPLQQRNIYEQDTFGLRQLDEKGRLHMFSVSGVHHHFWHRNETVLQKYILPWLN